MTGEQLKSRLNENERNAIVGICKILADYEGNICDHIADFVSSLCCITKERMFSDSKSIDVAQARGLFFYAYRYMTANTYDKIGRITGETYGKRFTPEGVKSSIVKMSELIESNPIWSKRWSILKIIIKSQKVGIDELSVPITIKVPKNVTATIKKE
jgi:hypothetical protein